MFSCKISVTDIKKEKKLTKANLVSPDVFLEKRMENTIKKMLGFNWEILIVKDRYVYWGYPTASLFSSSYKIKKKHFFKTSLQELQADLPDYEKLDGIYIFKIIREKITKELGPKLENYTLGDVGKKYKNVLLNKEKQEIIITMAITWGKSWENKNELLIILNSKNIDEIKEIKIQ